jgi:BolA protein
VQVRQQIEERLRGALHPVQLEVRDVSHRHADHSGSRPEGETHFELTITSPRFHGLGRLARHRLINEALADLLATRIHALAILEALPEETSRER